MGVLDDAIREHLELKRRHGSDPVEVSRLEREALGPVTAAELEAEDAPAWDDESDGVVFDDEVGVADPPAPPAFEEPHAGATVMPPPPPQAPAAPGGAVAPPPPATFAPPAGAPAPPPPASFAPPPPPAGLDDTFDFTEGVAPATAGSVPPPPPASLTPPPPPPAAAVPPPPPPAAAAPPAPPVAPPAPPAAAVPPPPAPPVAGTPTDGVPAMPRRRVSGGDTTQGETTNDPLSQTPEFLEETPDHDRLWFEQKPPRDFDF